MDDRKVRVAARAARAKWAQGRTEYDEPEGDMQAPSEPAKPYSRRVLIEIEIQRESDLERILAGVLPIGRVIKVID